MRRREVVALFGALVLGGASAMRRGWAALRGPRPQADIVRTLAAVADTMLPGDGLPAASALGLHAPLLAQPDLADLIADGVAALDDEAVRAGAEGFAALDESARLVALDAVFATADETMRRFVLTLRKQLLAAYYAEPAIKAAFAYTSPPQPGGFPDFEDRPA